MAQNKTAAGEMFNGQAIAEQFAADFITDKGAVSESVLEAAYDEFLHELHKNYERDFEEVDSELVCSDTKERKYKSVENLSNHGIFEITYDIVTINTREANRLGYRTPGGLKFTGKWYMTRKRAERSGYPVHDTVAWDNNINKFVKSMG